MYLYGRKSFALATHHKPLLAILGPRKSLPELVAAHLHRWTITLAAYNNFIEYMSTSNMENADALSRLPEDQVTGEVVSSILLVDASELPITSRQVIPIKGFKLFDIK